MKCACFSNSIFLFDLTSKNRVFLFFYNFTICPYSSHSGMYYPSILKAYSFWLWFYQLFNELNDFSLFLRILFFFPLIYCSTDFAEFRQKVSTDYYSSKKLGASVLVLNFLCQWISVSFVSLIIDLIITFLLFEFFLSKDISIISNFCLNCCDCKRKSDF